MGAGCNLFVTNVRKETAADCASSNGHHSIATALETKMVFTVGPCRVAPCVALSAGRPPVQPSDEGPPALEEAEEDAATSTAEVVGMRDHDLRCLQDQLLIETHQLLGVSVPGARGGWTEEGAYGTAVARCHSLLRRRCYGVTAGPRKPCWKPGWRALLAAVSVPESPCPATRRPMNWRSRPTQPRTAWPRGSAKTSVVYAWPRVRGRWQSPATMSSASRAGSSEWHASVAVPTCTSLLAFRYLHGKIELGEGHGIMCPAYSCYRLVPRVSLFSVT